MMVKLLVYGYCVGKPSSRKIERKRHLKALGALFAQVLVLCQKAGLVKWGHGAIDGTKMAANASKHKAMSYGRMSEAEKKLQQQVDRLLAQAERVDAEEDAQYGKGKLIAFTHNLLKLASPPGRASPEPVTMAPLRSPKGHPRHASRRSARGRVGFRRTTTYGMESSRGAAALLSNINQSRRRTGGAFAVGKSPTDS
jgi:hypothetical protein